MNTIRFTWTRLVSAAVLAAGMGAMLPAAHATCAGQHSASHGANGEMPCYPQGQSAQKS
ncbi:MAG: hypothetical protein JXR43_07105 [Burkholderiaceae bacterium]|jgi:hypothetical protein|nr:hypothetical protein [Burkholderiaceae bacterium]